MSDFLYGPLRWTESGDVLATWHLTESLPVPQNDTDAQVNIDIQRRLFDALAGHQFWLEGLLCWTSEEDIVDAMLAEGRDRSRRFIDATSEALDYLEDHALGHRRFLLSIQLPTTFHAGLARAGRAATNQVLSWGGLGNVAPSPSSLAKAMDQMKAVEQLLPAEFGPQRATPELIAWHRRHHIRRDGLDLTSIPSASDQELLSTQGGAHLETAGLDPSGISTRPKSERAMAPWQHQWLAVVNEDGETTYQTHLLLRSLPRQMTWPDINFLGDIDEAGVQVDYTITGVARSRIEAMSLNSKQLNKLTAQVGQVQGGSAGQTNEHLTRIRGAVQLLDDYNQDLTHDNQLCEIDAVVILSLSANDPDALDDMVAKIKTKRRDLAWSRPIGAEQAAFLARQPGNGPLPPELAAYRQVTHSRTWASAGAVTGSRLGDTTGLPMWIDQTLSLRRLVFVEPFGAGNDYKKEAASMVTVGGQGAGKTHEAMTNFGQFADMGARVVATDTTREREWSQFARSLNTSLTEIDIEKPQVSIDPLRFLEGNEASEVAAPFLSTLLDIRSTTPEALALREVLAPAFLAEHHVDSTTKLLSVLPKATRAGKDVLGDKLELWVDKDRWPAVFDLSLPPADTNRQVFIFGTYGVQLPTVDELRLTHLYERIDDAKIMGRAIYSLYSWIAKTLMFRDPDEPSLENVDEFHHLLGSPEATRGQMEILRYMRHVLASTRFQTQFPELPEEMMALITIREVLKVKPEALPAAARFMLDKNASEESITNMISLIKTHTAPGEGAGIVRIQNADDTYQVARVRSLEPWTAARRAAIKASSRRPEEAVA